MLSQKNRLTKAFFTQPHERVFSRRGATLALSVLKLPVGEGPRVAVIVSKKTAKTAVVRNCARRRVYSVLRALLPLLAPDRAYVFRVDKSIVDVSFAELSREVRILLSRG